MGGSESDPKSLESIIMNISAAAIILAPFIGALIGWRLFGKAKPGEEQERLNMSLLMKMGGRFTHQKEPRQKS